jgi:hypothetical protein
MEEFLKAINTNPWWVFLAGVATFIALPMTFYLSKKSENKGEIVYDFFKSVVFDKNKHKVEEFYIKWHDVVLNNLTIYTFCLLNYGGKTIDRKDIPNLGKIQIKTNKCNILKIETVFLNNTSNNLVFKLLENDNEVEIDFDFLDQKDGIVFQVFLEEIKPSEIEIKGYVKGSGYVKKVKLYEEKSKFDKFIYYLSLLLLFCCILFNFYIYKPFSGNLLDTILFVFFVSLPIFLFFLLQNFKFMERKKLYTLPKSFSIFRGE